MRFTLLKSNLCLHKNSTHAVSKLTTLSNVDL